VLLDKDRAEANPPVNILVEREFEAGDRSTKKDFRWSRDSAVLECL
jgi:hypothetical protein